MKRSFTPTLVLLACLAVFSTAAAQQPAPAGPAIFNELGAGAAPATHAPVAALRASGRVHVHAARLVDVLAQPRGDGSDKRYRVGGPPVGFEPSDGACRALRHLGVQIANGLGRRWMAGNRLEGAAVDRQLLADGPAEHRVGQASPPRGRRELIEQRCGALEPADRIALADRVGIAARGIFKRAERYRRVGDVLREYRGGHGHARGQRRVAVPVAHWLQMQRRHLGGFDSITERGGAREQL